MEMNEIEMLDNLTLEHARDLYSYDEISTIKAIKKRIMHYTKKGMLWRLGTLQFLYFQENISHPEIIPF